MIPMIVAAVLLAQVQEETQADPRCAHLGSVTMQCRVAPDGRPFDCEVLSEAPARCGFGQAALDKMIDARFAPPTPAQGGRARFTVRFRLQNDPAAAGAQAEPPVDDSATLDQRPPSE